LINETLCANLYTKEQIKVDGQNNEIMLKRHAKQADIRI
jgi:hypothetical protein